ncbi:MAG: hypothetical protein AB2704_27055 [Candidatus Thiodiazotropha taylori]
MFFKKVTVYPLAIITLVVISQLTIAESNIQNRLENKQDNTTTTSQPPNPTVIKSDQQLINELSPRDRAFLRSRQHLILEGASIPDLGPETIPEFVIRYFAPYPPKNNSSTNSVWSETQYLSHFEALRNKKYDLIVLPLQEKVPQYDRVSRLMSARWISNEIEIQTGNSVMSPELALRLLGTNSNRLNNHKVKELAEQMNVNVIYLLLNNNPYTQDTKLIEMTVVEAKPNGEIIKQHAHSLEHPSLNTPLESVIKHQSSSIVSELYGDKGNLRKVDKAEHSNELQLPASLRQLPESSESSIQSAVKLQLLALMTPSILEFERRRLFERSLIALDKSDPSSSLFNLLQARANFYLTRRPISLTFLNETNSPAEVALKAYLDGNYIQLQSTLPKIDNPVLKLLAYLEFKALQHEYRKPDNRDTFSSSYSQQWSNLITELAHDKDPWYSPDNISFFSNISGHFPEFDQKYIESFQGKIVSGDFNLTDTANLPLEQDLFTTSGPTKDLSCCMSYSDRIELSDIWGLYKNHAIANLLRKLQKSLHVQGSYKKAYDIAVSLEPHLQGHPTFSRLYAEVCEKMAYKVSGQERRFYIEKAFKLADIARQQSGAVDIDTLYADMLMKRLKPYVPNLVQQNDPSYVINLENWDIPTSYTIVPKAILSHSSLRAFPYINTDFNVFKFTVFHEKWKDSRVIDYLEDHFNGHPDKSTYLAQRHAKYGRKEKAIQVLESSISEDPDNWEAYNLLGTLFIEDSKYSQAANIYSKYPGFSDAKNLDRVELTNNAFSAGNAFFWRGQYQEAQHFYGIAGSLNTGANTQYTSLQRLAWMKHDYPTSLEYAYTRGTRYNSKYGYRDYLVMLHLLGAHQEAESGFSALNTRYNTPHIWTSLFIGHRIEDKQIEKIADFITQYLNINSSENLQKQALRYYYLTSMVDRNPTSKQLEIAPKAPSILQRQDLSSSNLIKEIATNTSTASYSEDCSTIEIPCVSTNTNNITKHGDQFADHYDAYVDFKSGDHTSAFYKFLNNNQFNPALKISLQYDKNSLSSRKLVANYSLPYLATSAAMNSMDAFLKELLESFSTMDIIDDSLFDIELTKSIIHAYFGRLDESITALKTSFNKRPHTVWRPIYSWYQLTEITEWLFHYTGDSRYIELALDWVKRYQIIQPQFAWAYAFEATYSSNNDDRIRATGFALYLDPQSAWLTKVPEEIKAQAAKWWIENNPFILQNTDKDSTQI